MREQSRAGRCNRRAENTSQDLRAATRRCRRARSASVGDRTTTVGKAAASRRARGPI